MRQKRPRVDGTTKCANFWPALFACKYSAAQTFDRLRVNRVLVFPYGSTNRRSLGILKINGSWLTLTILIPAHRTRFLLIYHKSSLMNEYDVRNSYQVCHKTASNMSLRLRNVCWVYSYLGLIWIGHAVWPCERQRTPECCCLGLFYVETLRIWSMSSTQRAVQICKLLKYVNKSTK